MNINSYVNLIQMNDQHEWEYTNFSLYEWTCARCKKVLHTSERPDPLLKFTDPQFNTLDAIFKNRGKPVEFFTCSELIAKKVLDE